MLYRTILALIQKNMTDGLAEKVDIFYAAGKLTEAEYNDIVGKLDVSNGN